LGSILKIPDIYSPKSQLTVKINSCRTSHEELSAIYSSAPIYRQPLNTTRLSCVFSNTQ